MQLRKPCQHGRYEEHDAGLDEGLWPDPALAGGFYWKRNPCPGGSNATFDDLISALREQGAEGIVQVRYVGPESTLFHIDEALV